ncbi:hypothetical protein AKJ16_DCAP23803, partial [Drosera capensis]
MTSSVSIIADSDSSSLILICSAASLSDIVSSSEFFCLFINFREFFCGLFLCLFLNFKEFFCGTSVEVSSIVDDLVTDGSSVYSSAAVDPTSVAIDERSSAIVDKSIPMLEIGTIAVVVSSSRVGLIVSDLAAEVEKLIKVIFLDEDCNSRYNRKYSSTASWIKLATSFTSSDSSRKKSSRELQSRLDAGEQAAANDGHHTFDPTLATISGALQSVATSSLHPVLPLTQTPAAISTVFQSAAA